jgi:protein-S-isoprenylcysteine O-methyltransferase Ste14
VRHPSYTGALLAFLGLGLCIGNWLSILLLIVPIFLVFLRRMHVEEAALVRGLGEPYREYMRHTKRLVPALY